MAITIGGNKQTFNEKCKFCGKDVWQKGILGNISLDNATIEGNGTAWHHKCEEDERNKRIRCMR